MLKLCELLAAHVVGVRVVDVGERVRDRSRARPCSLSLRIVCASRAERRLSVLTISVLLFAGEFFLQVFVAQLLAPELLARRR